MEIWIDVKGEARGITEEQAREAAARILHEMGLDEAELSMVLVDDVEMERLNLEFLRREGPTNVIAFSQIEGEGNHITPHLLGDVVISLDTCRREAEEAGMAFQERFLELLVHGILHLIGHEHESGGEEARRMEAEEQRILSSLRPTSIEMHGSRGAGGRR